MEIPVKQTFNKSVIGASHIRSGKPCQDFSLSYQDGNVKILVVCDGHGGSTYFRSDTGAEIAAKACLENLIDFAAYIPAAAFIGKSFAITAKPQKNPFVDADGNRVRYEHLNETQQQYAKQAQAYINAEGECQEQQTLIKKLLADIYSDWKNRIIRDECIRPLSKNEKEILSGCGIEKAYGCTMLAFMQTEHYWLSFQIGDGEIYLCDKKLSWKKPVPEDCACFLNYTTSLCDSNPLIEFRYALSGQGDSPLAVMLCSDGLDGSLRSEENITDFFEQVIGLYIDGDDIEAELEDYLPQLSEMGNKDDISLAVLIEIADEYKGNLRNLLDLRKESRSIQSEFSTRKQEIETLSSRFETLRIKVDRHNDSRRTLASEIERMRQALNGNEQSLKDLDKVITGMVQEMDGLRKSISEKISEFEDWKFCMKNKMADIEIRQNELAGEKQENHNNDYTIW